MQECGCKVLFNSRGSGVVNALRDQLPGAQRVRLAVGYLFIEGLFPLLSQLEKVDRTELLIANVVNRLTEEQIREAQDAIIAGGIEAAGFAQFARLARDRSAVETAMNLRNTIEALPRTSQNISLIVKLAGLIAQGRLLVRLLSSSRLHAKVALVSYCASTTPQTLAIVGSSNITLTPAASTPEACGPDLDLLLDDPDQVKQLEWWFETHWANAQDFHKELFEELGNSWALHRPDTS